MKRFIPIAVWLIVATVVRAQTSLYEDGTWIVTGLVDTNPGPPRIDVSVGGQPAGSFSELLIYRSYAGGFPLVYSIRASGALTPAVPPSGVLGGSFHLTGYWDCYSGEQLDVRIVSLNIQPNTGNYKVLNFNGAVSDGAALQATDLTLKLKLPDSNTVRMDVRYTLYAVDNLCVDQWHQQYGEGFQVARMVSNFISEQEKFNDGARVNTVIGQNCDCCGCNNVTGYVCAPFFNADAYVFPFPTHMSDNGLHMMHWTIGPRNTAALKIDLKKPSRKQCSVQGHILPTTDPAADNVNLWINWDNANQQYTLGQKVRQCRFGLVATLPESKACDIVLP